MLKNYFIEITKNAVNKAVENQELGAMTEFQGDLVCDNTKDKKFGDYAINVSSLARSAKIAPPLIAQNIAKYIESSDIEVNTVQGFINFKIGNNFLNKIVTEILDKKDNYLKSNYGNGEKVNIEYVSANPTGPFHIGHGRWAALGSALASIMKYLGYDVFQEFYINDAGNQIQKLGKSLEIRVRQLQGEDIEMEEGLYPGEYLIDCAKRYIKDNKGLDYADFAKLDMLNQQKDLLEKFGTHFDLFFSELALYQDGEVDKAMEALKKAGKIYEKDDAVWFKSSDYGDDQDRVLIKTDGKNTYLTADIAYHKNKFDRGFDRLINIWGADHHGYIPRMKAAMEALGYNPDKLEVLLGQLVNLIQNGEQQRMGKRKKMFTLDELIDEVGVDATRFWMLMRSSDTTIDFDVDLAKSQSDKNPVFYVQYAHARSCSILRKAVEMRLDVDNKTQLEPYFKQEEIDEYFKKADITKIFKGLSDDSFNAVKALILKLEEGKSLLENAVKYRAPYMICKYLTELAGDFHHFYNYTRVLSDDKDDSLAKLAIVNCFRIVMKIMLDLIGVCALEKM
ncbi:MAG: arginine--tRNA ligase [Candidatus Gastranaerophilales bacterium]|nr:arginine--tRNA ligase [Candidatus Gastranaerophilales bacterium]